MIEIKNLVKIYNKGKTNEFCALKGIDLSIEEGEMVAIIGKSGAGKSTLLHILAAIDSYDKGSYLVDGVSVGDLKEKDRARFRNQKIGIVMQDYALIDEYTIEENVQIPLIYAEPTAQQLGKLASEMAGSPSDSLAVFAVAGSNTQTVEQGVRDLADFLHMLGNPVGVISAGNSQSLERFLDLNYPLSILDVQRTMAVCAEDGAAAVILALSEETLNDDALQSVNVDVLGCDDKGLSEAEIVKSVARFGCTVGKQTHIAGRTQESDALAAQATEAYGQTDSSALSLSIAMVLAAGVRKANIKSALRVSRDLN